MKVGRVIAGGLGLLVIVTFAGAAYLAIYLDRHRDLLELGVSKAMGREVRIEGGVKLRFSMTPSVSLEGLWVSNPEWAVGPYFARAGQAVVSFDLMALFSRRLEIRQVTLLKADLLLETAADGRHNWTFGSARSKDTGGVEFTLDELTVEDSSVHYRALTGKDHILSVPNLSFDRPRPGLMALEGGISFMGVPLSLSGNIEHKADTESDSIIAVQLGIPDATLAITGDLAANYSFSRLQMELQSARLDLHKWLALLSPATAFDGSLKKVSAQFNSAGGTLESLVSNAGGELKVASAELSVPKGKDAKVGSVVLTGLSASVAPGQTVRLLTKLVHQDHSYQVDLAGGSLADLFTGGKSWDRLKLSAKGQFAGRPLEITGNLGPWSPSQGGGLGLNLTLRHEGLRVGLNGTLASFDGLQGSRFAVKASAPSLARLSPWTGVAVPESPPFEFSSNVEGGKQQLRLTDLSLTAGGSDISGKLMLPMTKGGRFEAVLESRVLDLKPYLPQSGKAAKDGGVPILDWELPPSALQGMEGSLVYKADHLKTEDLELESVDLDAVLDKGNLKLSLLAEDERLTLDTDLKPAGEHWQLALNHKGKLDLGSLVDREQLVSDRSKSPMDIELTLQASGNSLGAILDSAHGNFLMVLGEGELSEKFSPNLPLGDVLFTLLNVINPGGKPTKNAKLECAVIQLDIAKGIATSTKGLAVRTDNFNVLGGGALKLRTGEIDLHFKTANRKGLGISLLGVADRLVRLTGTLDDPKVGVNVGGAVAYGAAAWATGGLSVLYDSVFTRLTAFSNPCDAVLKAVGGQP